MDLRKKNTLTDYSLAKFLPASKRFFPRIIFICFFVSLFTFLYPTTGFAEETISSACGVPIDSLSGRGYGRKFEPPYYPYGWDANFGWTYDEYGTAHNSETGYFCTIAQKDWAWSGETKRVCLVPWFHAWGTGTARVIFYIDYVSFADKFWIAGAGTGLTHIRDGEWIDYTTAEAKLEDWEAIFNIVISFLPIPNLIDALLWVGEGSSLLVEELMETVESQGAPPYHDTIVIDIPVQKGEYYSATAGAFAWAKATLGAAKAGTFGVIKRVDIYIPDQTPPQKPILQSPADGITLFSYDNIELKWEGADDWSGVAYEYYIGNEDFTQIWWGGRCEYPTNNVTISLPLYARFTPSYVYACKVKAIDRAGNESWSDVHLFTVSPGRLSISGYVKDISGNGIEGVTVNLAEPSWWNSDWKYRSPVMINNTDLLFNDDFNDGNNNGWTVFQGDWQVINGEYVYGANGITDVDGVTAAGDVNWENYTYESKFKFIAGNPQIYFLFRFTDYFNYERYDGYSFQYANNRWYLYRWYTETRIPTLIAERLEGPITPDAWYNVKVEVSGDHIKCYVNDELKIEAHDSAYPRGRIGFRADCSKVAFDDARVTIGTRDLTDYQVPLEINTASLIAAGRLRSDAGDLRFTTSDGVELPYWIGSGINTASTKIWVRVPFILANGTTKIYMYYGNPSSQSSSNGNATFEFFDDFDSGLDKWNNFGSPSPATFQSSEFHDGWGYSSEGDSWYPSGSYTKQPLDITNGIVIETRHKNLAGNIWDTLAVVIGSKQTGYAQYPHNEVYCGYHIRGYNMHANGDPTTIEYHALDYDGNGGVYDEPNDEAWHRFTFKYNASTTEAKYYRDGIFKYSASCGTRPYDALPIVLGGRDYHNTNFLDYIFARKYVEPEPTILISPEEETHALISESYITGSDGCYIFSNLPTGDYTVTPAKTEWTFLPPFYTYFSLSIDQFNQNFIGLNSSLERWQTLLETQNRIFQAAINSHNFRISQQDNIYNRLLVFLGWEGSDLNLSLIQPDGKLITPEVAELDPNITFTSGSTNEIYIIKDPIPGNWQMMVEGIDVPPEGESYTLTATGIIRDSTPPITKDDYAYNNIWTNKDAHITLSATDDFSGVSKTFYSISSSGSFSLQEGTSIIIDEEGEYVIEYWSVDKAGNSEEPHRIIVKIDKTPSQVSTTATPDLLWPPNHKMHDVTINGSATDALSGVASTTFKVTDEYGVVEPIISDFGSTIQLEAWRKGNDRDGRTYTISATATDYAGNKATISTIVTCPHDQRKK